MLSIETDLIAHKISIISVMSVISHASLKLYVRIYYLCSHIYACGDVCVHVLRWRPDVRIECLPQPLLILIFLFVERVFKIRINFLKI